MRPIRPTLLRAIVPAPLALLARRSVLPAAILVAISVAPLAVAQSPAGQANAATFFQQPSVFVENRGQWEGDFIYKTRVGAMTVFVERSGWTFTLVEGKANDAVDKDELLRTMKHEEDEVARGVAVRMHFVGTAGAEDLVPGARSSGVHNYFLGNDATRWRTDVPLYEAVRLARVWPGIDVDARIEARRFEYDVIVSPGADLSQVVIEVDGAEGLRLEADGTLVIDTVLGPVRQPRSQTWQVMPDGEREPVACDYLILDAARFGFSAPAWDRERPLVIDPGLFYSTYLGGGNRDFASAVAVDASGAAIVAGYTESTDFPTTSGAFAVSLNGIGAAFVTRLNSAGNGLFYSTYLGGGSFDSANAVALDASGAVTVAGRTGSADFPTTPGAYDTSHNGGLDVFVARVNATGNGLLYSTYLGGANSDGASAVAVDASGAVTVAGSTDSTNFPTTPGAYDTSHNGGYDVFVARLTPAAAGLLYSTYLGGSEDDYCYAGVVDASGAATVAGETVSANFPTTSGAYDTSFDGGQSDGTDAFVARLTPAAVTPAAAGLLYSTYLGGIGDDVAYAVAVDASGAATVGGRTHSYNYFPTTAGPFGSANATAFVTRLNATGSGLLYSARIGAGPEIAFAVAVDAAGAATVAGWVGTSGFPTTNGAYDTTYNGGGDIFVARLNPTFTGFVYSTYLGGAGSDGAWALALDASGAATVAGYTDSTNLPTTSGAYDPSFNGGSQDAFVARLQLEPLPYPLMAFPANQTVPVGGFYGLQVAGPAGASVALMFDATGVCVPVPPFGAIGVGIPPLLTFDGIGLGFPASVPMPLTIGTAGMLSFSYSPVPANLSGMTLYAQAVASFAGSVALSTHGNASLPTPACQVTIVP